MKCKLGGQTSYVQIRDWHLSGWLRGRYFCISLLPFGLWRVVYWYRNREN